ncbi:DUF3306 domain-containing protein [Polynucleobacter sp. MWH-UH35A]|uniref:DUF3306 domain-containing protein n=1 Tax=Polynucleobacter sp. MWH-UH35A TaxID=1855619 RepID=UPI001BFE9C30|nr:DUF3306 domain-containing protein [Polynucleobacter sp. MWH-UH35A]QWD60656.1 DUF3306 domain-containing protein [Polynucleobacter sp. MWH-UH35A]
MMAEGFLGRWSRRKAGKEVGEVGSPEKNLATPAEPLQVSPVEITPEDATPPVTLEDVAKIDRFDPDFSAFMRPDVDPAVQQAALKKMFTDPHFNIMDGLDIYIDDYSKPDPLPPGMLERMAQSDMLNLFRKSSEESPQAVQKNESQVLKPQVEDGALQIQEQSDLTSTQSIPASLDEVPKEALNEALIKSEQKKT